MKQPITAESQELLLEAMDGVAGLVDEGVDPSEAVAKAAAEYKLRPGHIPLLVRGFNVGQIETQRKSASVLDDALQTVPLADSEKVMNLLYPEAKTAAQEALETVISEDYNQSPAAFYEKCAAFAETAEKAQRWRQPMGEVPEGADPMEFAKMQAEEKAKGSLNADRRRRASMWKERDRKRRAADKVTMDKAALHTDILNQLTALKDFLCGPTTITHDQLTEKAAILYGEHLRPFLEQVGKTLPAPVMAKQAMLVVVEDHEEPWRTCNNLADLLKEYVKIDQLARDSIKEADDLEVVFRKEFAPPPPPPPRVVRSALEGIDEGGAVKESFFNAAGAALGSAFGSTLGREVSQRAVPTLEPLEKLEDKAYGQLTDPTHEATLRNINAQTMLTDIIADDPVLGGYEPTEVVDHFNELSQLAPRAMGMPAIARGILRRRLQQGSSDPFELEQLLKIENQLKTRPGGEGGSL